MFRAGQAITRRVPWMPQISPRVRTYHDVMLVMSTTNWVVGMYSTDMNDQVAGGLSSNFRLALNRLHDIDVNSTAQCKPTNLRRMAINYEKYRVYGAKISMHVIEGLSTNKNHDVVGICYPMPTTKFALDSDPFVGFFSNRMAVDHVLLQNDRNTIISKKLIGGNIHDAVNKGMRWHIPYISMSGLESERLNQEDESQLRGTVEWVPGNAAPTFKSPILLRGVRFRFLSLNPDGIVAGQLTTPLKFRVRVRLYTEWSRPRPHDIWATTGAFDEPEEDGEDQLTPVDPIPYNIP